MIEKSRGALFAAFVVSLVACAASGGDAGGDPTASVNGTDGTSSGGNTSGNAGANAGANANATGDGGASANADAGADANATASSGPGNYGSDGSVPFSTQSVPVTNGSHSFSIDLYTPTSPGAHPFVSLSPGLMQPAIAYAPFAKRLASHGIAVAVRDDPGVLTQTPDVVTDIAYVVTTAAPAALGASFDATRVGLAGHSRGGKASLLAAENELAGKTVAWFGLDPVDASTLAGGKFAVDGVGKLTIPTAYFGASVSSSCSPAAANFDVLFKAGASPKVEITGIGVGHTQLEDQSHCGECSICTPAGTADPAVALEAATRYMAAFFGRELLGDKSVGPAFEGAGAAADIAKGTVTITAQ
jgi:predicted dienelactone hydrolase